MIPKNLVVFVVVSISLTNITTSTFDVHQQVVTTIDAKLDAVYTRTLKWDQSIVLFYNTSHNTTKNNMTLPVRLSVFDNSSMLDTPLLVSVRQAADVLSFTVPFTIDHVYGHVERTICPSLNYPEPSSASPYVFAVDLSTSAQKAVTVTATARRVQNFVLKANKPLDYSVSPATPHYMLYLFEPGQDEIVVEVSSESNICATVSIQEPSCPVFDLSRNVQFRGRYQTMTQRAALTVTTSEDGGRYALGFHLVIIVKDSDFECAGIDTIIIPGTDVEKERTKRLTAVLVQPPGVSSYLEGIFIPLGAIALLYIISGVLCCSCKDKLYIDLENEQVQVCSSRNERANLTSTSGSANSYGTVDGDSAARPDADDEITSMNRERVDGDMERAVVDLYVSNLAKRGQRYHGKKAGFFYRHLLVVAVFYGLPVIQLVLVYLKILNNTGDLDLCYYNLRCSRPWYLFTNFNNVFSNVGYVLLAGLYLLIVTRRHRKYMALEEKHREDEIRFGIPQHFGLYYAMGIAFAMEGVLSASYHVCPSAYNFQFDTAFMYVLAVLQMLKLYQARHPDVSPNASSCCLVLALIICVAVIGVFFYTSWLFWVVFTLVYLLFSIAVAVHFYYLGAWKLNLSIFSRMLQSVRRRGCCCRKPKYPKRFLLILIGMVLNWCGAVYGLVVRPSDFATFMLEILLGNLFLYAVFYVMMKLLHGEGVGWLTILYTLLAVLCWIPALYYFTHAVTDWKLTPAQSRALNEPCLIFDFYDNHDVWHFLSAGAIFFSFLVLLTLDDNVQTKKMDAIHVF